MYMQKQWSKPLLTLFILSFVSFCMVTYRVFLTKSIMYAFLIWNIFLAWIPLIISIYLYERYKDILKRKKGRVLFILLHLIWLFFYPNAPYIMTDFIHLSKNNYYSVHLLFNTNYNNDLLIWYDFIIVALAAWIGSIAGFISLYMIQNTIKEIYNKWIGWTSVVVTLVLSGFAIYLGRFIRWNSWDIISNPIDLINSIVENITIQSILFTLMFALFLNLTYFTLYSLKSFRDR